MRGERVLGDRSGMALVLTLLAVSFLVAVTVELNTSVTWQMQAAANQGTSIRLGAMLLSGLQLARTALWTDQQENTYDSRFDSWGAFDPDVAAGLFPGGSMEIQVSDLSGRLQVNGLVPTAEEKKKREKEQDKDSEKVQREIWKRFLLSGDFAVEDEDEVALLLDSLMDWIDEDDEEREHGAEQGYYSSLKPAYAAANRPLLSVEELLLVRGWNRKLLYGDEEHSGIIDYLTVAGQDAKININTAPAPVLQALQDEMTEDLASDLIDFRNDEENREVLAQADWYKRVRGVPGDLNFDSNRITTQSSFFLVTITARIDELQRTGTGILQRMDNREQQLLYWKIQ